MIQFLLDENLSYETAQYLTGLGYKVFTVEQLGLSEANDQTIIRYASEHGYVLITFDLDFGYLFQIVITYPAHVVILRLEDQTVESVNQILQRLCNEKSFTEMITQTNNSLITIDESTIRIRQ